MKAKAPRPVPAARGAPGSRFAGRYVALRALAARDVLASGRSARRVLAAARRRGVPSPLVVYVPAPDHGTPTLADITLASEAILRREWDTPEEDRAWADL